MCRVVGVGASAGGLESFTRLLRALPADTGLAFVLVQHLDPTHASMLAEILGRETTMPVAEAVNGAAIEADHVYVTPPNVGIAISDGRLKLVRRKKPPAVTLPIDTFLISLAQDREARAIGVVLSGTGSDGTRGLAAIKEAGGVTFAEDPSTAEYPGMPRAAWDAGVVDLAREPEGIAAELVRLGGSAEPEVADERPEALGAADRFLERIVSLVRAATGLDLSRYRRTTLLRRISRRMLLKSVASLEEYVVMLEAHPAEVQALYADVLVNMTSFFRDPEAMEALAREVFPEVLSREARDEAIRIWVPGCAKGQEAYSILIALIEFLDTQPSRPDIQMFASDVNESEIEIARAGVYPATIAHEVSPERLGRFFTEVPEGYQIDRTVRERCVFAVHDVTRDPPFSRLDIVSFRNVLIYMERDLQQRVLQTLHYALEEGGFLLLGGSEAIGPDSALFTVVDKKHRIFRRKPGPARLLPAASAASRAGVLGGRTRAQNPPAFDVLAEAEKVVLARYQPSGILVNADLDVLQFRGRIAPFLDPAEGPPVLRLPQLIGPVLSSAAETAIREAARTHKPASRRGLAAERDGRRRDIEVEAVPIPSPGGEPYYLVLFGERETGPSETTDAAREGADTAGMAQELDDAREQLEAVAAEKETAIAELRATTERLQSSNEELRTINEEFQTAQEELQSTNEELTTLNDELRNRNTELGHLTDDLNNVIEGVEIPILILDSGLRIRRYTPQAQAIVSIVPTDIGRPMGDFRLKVAVPDLAGTIRAVLRSGEPSQTEVRSEDGRWYSMRIRPYRVHEEGIDGAVIAFLDIDLLKRSMQEAAAAQDHAEAVVDSVREPLITLDVDLRVRDANAAFYESFQTSAEETLGHKIHELGDGHWDFPELRALLEEILPGDREFSGLEVEREFPRIGRRVMALSARKVREVSREPEILLAIDDVTMAVRRTRMTGALNDIGAVIAATVQLDEALDGVLSEAARAMDADSAVVLLKQGGGWVVKGAFGSSIASVGMTVDEAKVPSEIGAPKSEAPTLLEDAAGALFDPSLGVDPEMRAVLLVPLVIRGNVIGSLTFHFRRTEGVFTQAEDDFLRRLGTMLSFAFENARLFATQRDIADTLQAALLAVPRSVPGIKYGHLYRSATRAAAVGGDFYDLFDLDDGRVGILIGDVSGKGVEAATLTALVKNTVRALAYQTGSPAEVLAQTNAVIYKATSPWHFVTVLFCILDTDSGLLVYCNAGHTRGLVKRHSGEVDVLEVLSPLSGAVAVAEYVDGEITIEGGDTLVLYTDGITEARQDGEIYGEERLIELLRTTVPTPAEQLPQAIFDEVTRFAGGRLADDVAMVAVERAPDDPAATLQA